MSRGGDRQIQAPFRGEIFVEEIPNDFQAPSGAASLAAGEYAAPDGAVSLRRMTYKYAAPTALPILLEDFLKLLCRHQSLISSITPQVATQFVSSAPES